MHICILSGSNPARFLWPGQLGTTTTKLTYAANTNQNATARPLTVPSIQSREIQAPLFEAQEHYYLILKPTKQRPVLNMLTKPKSLCMIETDPTLKAELRQSLSNAKGRCTTTFHKNGNLDTQYP
eukprot:6212157-Pleurochrysis_carterae.AAC.1